MSGSFSTREGKHGTEGKALVKELKGGVEGQNCMHDGLMD